VASKKISMGKNVIVVTGSLIQAYGSLEGGVGRGSGEAQSINDTNFENGCHVI